MVFADFAKTLDKIAKFSSRNSIVEELTYFYKKLNLEEAQVASFFLTNCLKPSFVNLKFNLATKSLQSFLVEFLQNKVVDFQKMILLI